MQVRARPFAAALVSAVVTLALPALAHARPADVNVVNSSPFPVTISGGVGIDPAQNTVQIGGQPVQVQPLAVQPFHQYAFIPSPTATGGKSCVPFTIPAGDRDRLDTVSVTTYNDASAIAYLRYFVKEASSTSRILTMRVLTNAVGNDPVTNSRSGILSWGMHIAGGNVFDVQLGEVHSLNGCIQSSTGASATGTFMLDGISE
jgi:hypothetical protein